MLNLKKAGCGSVIDTHIHFPIQTYLHPGKLTNFSWKMIQKGPGTFWNGPFFGVDIRSFSGLSFPYKVRTTGHLPSLRAVEKIAVLFRAEKGGVDQLLTCHDHAFL